MVLTLLTDFGLSDSYVAVMKGTIAQINPHLLVIDITHHIPPQEVTAARFQLMNAYPYFPTGTVHVAVVDPGVGSTRRAIAVQLESGYLVAPDNGLLSGVLDQYAAIAAVELTNPHYWRVSSPSHTFHGRDIFAPVGAHLTRGVPLQALGTEIDLSTIVQLPIPSPQFRQQDQSRVIEGCIQAIDHFGNLITNVLGSEVAGKRWKVRVADFTCAGKTTYSDVERGEMMALVGSHGWVEIAANHASAQARLRLAWGSSVQVVVQL